MTTFLAIALLLLLLILRVPIAFSLAISGAMGLVLVDGVERTLLHFQLIPYRSAANFILTTVPLFVLMAELLNKSELAQPLFAAARSWIGHFRGGLAIGTALAGAAFGSCCGASAAAAATFAPIAVPEMRRVGYSDELSTGAVAITGTLAAMIPPSVILILYGAETETSIGRLLIAVIFPGILLTTLYSINIYLWARLRPQEAPSISKATWSERVRCLVDIWHVVLVGATVAGVIYLGVATPSEAAAFGTIAVLLIGLAMGRLDLRKIFEAGVDTVETTAMIFLIIIGAGLFSVFLTTTGSTQAFLQFIQDVGAPSSITLLIVVFLYLLLGMFLDAIGCMLLTLPLVFPLMVSLGYDPVWFGVFVVLLLEMGLLTPPVGILCFIVSGASGVALSRVFVGALRMLPACFLLLLLLYVFPQIALFLPSQMMSK